MTRVQLDPALACLASLGRLASFPEWRQSFDDIVPGHGSMNHGYWCLDSYCCPELR